MIGREIVRLIRRDIRLELKQRYALNGLLLYVLSTIFVCYLSFKSIVNVPVWNALFWIIILFTALSAAGKSFSTESRGRLLYYYSLASAQAVILSRILYNSLLMILISLGGYVIYSLFIGNLVEDQLFFLLGIVLGGSGFSSVLTLMAAIASKTNNNITLMSILSFPVIIPLLLVLIRFTKNAADGLERSVQIPYLTGLIMIQLIVIALAWMLFPFLWKD